MKRSLAMAACFVFAAIGTFAAESSCVTCHTSDATMKTLFVPPVLAEAEGEG